MNNMFYEHSGIVSLSVARFFRRIDDILFTPDFEHYEHLTFFNDPNTFKWLVLGLYFGIIVASLIMFYNKNVLGSFVRRLDAAGCTSRENAKTVGELGCGKNIFYRISLRTGYSLRNVVVSVNGTNDTDGVKKVPYTQNRYYIPEEKKETVLRRFNAKGSGWLSVLLIAAIGLVLVILLFLIAPFIVGMIESTINGFSSGTEVIN